MIVFGVVIGVATSLFIVWFPNPPLVACSPPISQPEATNISPWLRCLGAFCGFTFRKYNIELAGILQVRRARLG